MISSSPKWSWLSFSSVREKVGITEAYREWMHAISAPGFKVQFVNDTISLKIPEVDVCLQNGWTITPLNTPYGQSVPSA